MRLCKHAKSLKSTKTFRTNYQFYFSLQSINDESKYGEFFDKAESVSETLGKPVNVVIKNEFIVYNNTQNSFFAILKDFPIKEKFSLFRFTAQALVMTFISVSNIWFSWNQEVLFEI